MKIEYNLVDSKSKKNPGGIISSDTKTKPKAGKAVRQTSRMNSNISHILKTGNTDNLESFSIINFDIIPKIRFSIVLVFILVILFAYLFKLI